MWPCFLMTCTWGRVGFSGVGWVADKESAINDFRRPAVAFKLLSRWNYPLFPPLRSGLSQREVRRDHGRPRHGHLLGPNWPPLQLMASCSCVFTSHLFCGLCFPAPETRQTNFKSLFPQLSVSGALHRLSVCLPLPPSSLKPSLSFYLSKQAAKLDRSC